MWFYAEILYRTNTSTHNRFYAQKTVTHKHVYIHTFLHTDCFTHKYFYTKTFLHTDSFAHKLFYTLLVFTHKNVYTQTLVCRNTSRHNRFYTLTFLQTRLHANTSTHRPFDTQTLLHTTRLHPIYHGKYAMFQTTNQNPIDHWLVVYLPPWKMIEFVSWGDDIPNWMESHKIPWFQTTNQDHVGKTAPCLPSPNFTVFIGMEITFQVSGKNGIGFPTFTHRRFCTQPLTHKLFYTQSLLHAGMFTHKRLYAETLLHTNAFTH